ncbi:hypothetical protein DRF67_10475 [Chryseobacterium pennipullorum]|uniref:Uncharacterized protein n=1 Tax=Chryseobacterium pennipullorum TaxID=2258963 RepID=A0A3D9B2Q0_9FLAO|nr:hypothetical protein DRF67_10475 [Chryseobacterium pennipullorum]
MNKFTQMRKKIYTTRVLHRFFLLIFYFQTVYYQLFIFWFQIMGKIYDKRVDQQLIVKISLISLH